MSPSSRISVTEIASSVYSMNQTGPNSHQGGAANGFFNSV